MDEVSRAATPDRKDNTGRQPHGRSNLAHACRPDTSSDDPRIDVRGGAMSTTPAATALVAVLGGVVAGCGDSASPPPSTDPVTVRVIDEKQFAQALDQHRGKVVLVDCWALWCIECLELFPHTVQLHHRFAARGLAVISLSFDDPDGQQDVLRFLESKGATFDNFISRYGGSTESADAFGLDDLILPRLHLYDRTGNLRKAFRFSEGPIEPEDIDRAVEELLDQS